MTALFTSETTVSCPGNDVSFERWLQRSALPKGRLEIQLKRLRILKKIMNLADFDSSGKQQLKEQLESENTHDKEWLLEKLIEKR